MRLLFFFIAALSVQLGFCQVSGQDNIQYQALIFDADNHLLRNSSVGVEVSIIRDSMNGTTVYTEYHQKETDGNGLLTLNIGAGNAQTGTYDSIDWAAGSYFLQTKSDPLGGNNYISTRINQLLSVPYAFHAKTVEVERDPVFSASEAFKISSTDISLLDSLSGTNSGDQDLSGLITKTALTDSITRFRNELPKKLTAGANINISGDTIRASFPKDSSSSNDFYLGQDTLGGIVFFLYKDSLGQSHGLIACTVDTFKIWQESPTLINAFSYWDGKTNTSLMSDSPVKDYVDSLNSINYNGFNDWYIPSIGELRALYNNRYYVNKALHKINGILLSIRDRYWSSTEDLSFKDEDYAMIHHFGGNFRRVERETKDQEYLVRPIRSF